MRDTSKLTRVFSSLEVLAVRVSFLDCGRRRMFLQTPELQVLYPEQTFWHCLCVFCAAAAETWSHDAFVSIPASPISVSTFMFTFLISFNQHVEGETMANC